MGLWRKIIVGHCNITALYIFPAIKNKYITKETKKKNTLQNSFQPQIPDLMNSTQMKNLYKEFV